MSSIASVHLRNDVGKRAPRCNWSLGWAVSQLDGMKKATPCVKQRLSVGDEGGQYMYAVYSTSVRGRGRFVGRVPLIFYRVVYRYGMSTPCLAIGHVVVILVCGRRVGTQPGVLDFK